MTGVLAAEGVTVRAGGRLLLDRVSLSLEPGRITAIVGPNGAGKSTLLRVLAGERRPDDGRVTCLGGDLRDVPAARLAAIRAVLPQASRLAFPFTVREVVRIGLDGIGRGRADRAAILAAALEAADAGGLGDRLYQTLSGGEAQRVQFARVLAQLAAGRSAAPVQALLLDEPVSALDLRHQLGVLDRAAALARGGTAVLAILHDLNLASAFADTIAVMDGGRIAAAGPPAATLTTALVAAVFGVRLRVGAVPEDRRPFVLPFRPVLHDGH